MGRGLGRFKASGTWAVYVESFRAQPSVRFEWSFRGCSMFDKPCPKGPCTHIVYTWALM